MLLTKEFLDMLDKIVNNTFQLGLIPYKSNILKSKRYYIHKTKKYIYLNWVNRILTFGTLIFICLLAYASVLLFNQGLVSGSFVTLVIFMGLILLLVTCVQIGFWMYSSEICAIINAVLETLDWVDGKL